MVFGFTVTAYRLSWLSKKTCIAVDCSRKKRYSDPVSDKICKYQASLSKQRHRPCYLILTRDAQQIQQNHSVSLTARLNVNV